MNAIDCALAINPADCGESLADGRRIFFNAPLAIIFQVFEQQREVYVLQAWQVH